MSRLASMHSRPNRPPPSRKSMLVADIPATIYSQAASEFKPPADYVGPGNSQMSKPRDPSMNPTKHSLPVLSVSKLNVAVAPPPPSKTALPGVNPTPQPQNSTFAKSTRKLLESQQAQKILRRMPTVFQKQFESELGLKRKKRPCKGTIRKFVHFDFHDTQPTEAAILHGIVLLGGQHRDLFEEAPQEPRTPPPLSGRLHCISQTDTWLEDIADYEVEFKTTEMQCEAIYDEPLEPPQLQGFEKPGQSTTGTQLDNWVFLDLDHAFDQIAVNLTEAVVMEALRQLQEEFELEALRKQYEYHKCVRNREISILAKYKTAQSKYQQQREYLESHKCWEEDLDSVIEKVGFNKLRGRAPSHFLQSRTDQAIHEYVQEAFVPPINDTVTEQVEIAKESRNVLDSIIEEVVLMREAEYAGEMYVRAGIKKGSLATNTPSKLSFAEWMGEGYDELMEEEGDTPPFYLQEDSNNTRGTWRKSEETEGEDSDYNYTKQYRQSASSGSFASDEYEDYEDAKSNNEV